jgi:hypothetical protein
MAAPASAQDRSLEAITGHEFATRTASRFLSQQTRFGAGIIARTFAASLIRSRDAARADSHPIPADIRAALAGYYPEDLLDTVRYSVGDTTPDGLAGFAIRNGNAAAVTLIDTVVFSKEEYTQNLALWAHEIHHVHQYAEWGVEAFAKRYAFNWEMVEADARARTEDFIAWYTANMAQ